MELGGGTAMLCAGSARGTALERCICGPLVLFPRSILHPPAHSCPAELDLGGLFLLFPVKSIHPPPAASCQLRPHPPVSLVRAQRGAAQPQGHVPIARRNKSPSLVIYLWFGACSR